ncbi:MAG: cobalamin biosynthesis protein [Planktomarina sp.]
MIIAGFGFRKGAQAHSFRGVLDALGAQVTHVATLTAKADDRGFQDFAQTAGFDVIAVSHADVMKVETPTYSEASVKAYGVGSVAEAAALAAAGAGAKLLGPRTISQDGMVTCALARVG